MVDDYGPVVAGLENDIDEIETEVFSGNAEVSRRIYELSREVIEFQRATAPLVGMLSSLIEDGAYQSLGFALFAEVAYRLEPNFADVFERRTIIIRELRQHPGEKKHRKRRGLAAVAADQERTRGVLH